MHVHQLSAHLVGGNNAPVPLLLLRSFSFPSGHTSSAVFLIGALCFVLVPVTNIYMRETGKQQRTTRAWRLPSVLTGSQGSWGMWASSALVTGTGRVLADAHWLTDCVGASFVSMALVSLLARAVYKATGVGSQLPIKDSNPSADTRA
jgi:membrane-associated phospholipid phosphatase